MKINLLSIIFGNADNKQKIAKSPIILLGTL